MINFVKVRKEFIQATQDLSNEQWNDYENNPFCVWAHELENYHLKNCRLLGNREQLLDYLPKNAVVAEVGTQHGFFSEKIIAVTQPQKLHLLDINFDDFNARIRQEENGVLSSKIKEGTVEIHEGDSSQILSTFPENYFDWIYIDADHSYQGVCKDIAEGHKKVKKGGLIAFNDYTNWSVVELIPYGVSKAINEFCINYNWEIIFLALDGFGYHDVVIRKIDEDNELPDLLPVENEKLKTMESQIQQLQSSLEEARQQIQQMENDGFGQLRKYWGKLQKIMGRS